MVGKDRFLRNEAVSRVVRSLEEDGESMGPTTVEGGEASLAEVLDEVRTMTLLGDRRVVIVDDADSFIKEHRKALEDYCELPCHTGTLILAANSMPKTTKLHKIIAKHGEVVVVNELAGREVVSWVERRAESVHGKRIAKTAAYRLQELVGDSPAALDAELAKLAVYIAQKDQIKRADVDALVGQHKEELVFRVIDAMASGDTAGALRHWEQVVATDRAAPGRAIGGLAYGVRRILERGSGRGYASSSGGFTTRDLQRQLKDLCHADLAVKTGASTFDVAIEKFIVVHSQSVR